ncbi:hypothetical protein HPB47_024484, partial [Ixodes persulcatus]
MTLENVLKDKTVHRPGLSEQRRLQRRITTKELEDKASLQLLRRMRELLANATIDDALFRHQFLQ